MEKSTTKPTRTMLDRAAWIKAAIDLLADENLDGLRVEVLAKRLGVTKGSFYWHFKDRRDLLDAVLDDWKEGRIRDIRKQTAADPGEELAAIRHTIAIYSAARNRRGIAIERAFRVWARHDPRAAAVVEEVDAVRLDCARRLFLARGVPTGEAAARSVLLYAYVFGVTLMHCDGFDADLDAAKKRIAELIAD
ncbi:MAG TPA: TetR/AcrR family transcriptional regulator [Rhodocyclaceae bacterium]|nr:TetR/AcrR family transcriptional regulator [Rhodocyclaceae bacterium]